MNVADPESEPERRAHGENGDAPNQTAETLHFILIFLEIPEK